MKIRKDQESRCQGSRGLELHQEAEGDAVVAAVAPAAADAREPTTVTAADDQRTLRVAAFLAPLY